MYPYFKKNKLKYLLFKASFNKFQSNQYYFSLNFFHSLQTLFLIIWQETLPVRGYSTYWIAFIFSIRPLLEARAEICKKFVFFSSNMKTRKKIPLKLTDLYPTQVSRKRVFSSPNIYTLFFQTSRPMGRLWWRIRRRLGWRRRWLGSWRLWRWKDARRCRRFPGGPGWRPRAYCSLLKREHFFHKKNQQQTVVLSLLSSEKTKQKKSPKKFPHSPQYFKMMVLLLYIQNQDKQKMTKKKIKSNSPKKKIRILLLPKTTPKIPQQQKIKICHTPQFFFTSNEQDTRKKKK